MDASDRRRRAAAEAAEWWVQLQGEASRGEHERYVDWLRESSVHVAEMLRVAQVHGALAQFERWSELATGGSGDEGGTVVALPVPAPETRSSLESPKPLPRRWRLAASIAAMLIVAAGLAAALLFALRGQVIETQRGERRQVALADGSLVQVDPETRLRVNYESRTRRVILERGRALFHVAKNPERPFLVQADDTTVRAVGTAFAVEQGADAVVVTVAEGRVAVFPAHASPAAEAAAASRREPIAQPAATPARPSTNHAASPPDSKTPSAVTESSPGMGGAGEIFLVANEQVTVAASGSAEPVRTVDSGRALAWAEGRLIFENAPVERAVAQFNRYNRIQLAVNDATLARRPISGVFSAADPESFVAFIQSVATVRVTRSQKDDITIEAAK